MIEGTEYDRRRKLTESDKQTIRKMFNQGDNRQSIASAFGISKRMVYWIGNPESVKTNLKSLEKRGGWKIYHNKKAHAKRIREYRQYIKELKERGIIDGKD